MGSKPPLVSPTLYAGTVMRDLLTAVERAKGEPWTQTPTGFNTSFSRTLLGTRSAYRTRCSALKRYP
jgi:hypothetical protein